MSDDDHPVYHQGEDHSAPYPVSRLAPSFGLVDLAAEIARADAMLSARTGAQLRVIADQMRHLQAEARSILEQAEQEAQLHHAHCAFRKIPGKTYYLYRRPDGELSFSMLSPTDWGGRPPQEYVGAYRLETNHSWTPAERIAETGSADPADRLLDTLKPSSG